MRVYCRAQYLTSHVDEMRGPDYDAILLVQAVKGNEFDNYAPATIGGKRVIVTNKNKDDALRWFGEWAAQIVDSLGDGRKVLLPIPNTKVLVDSADDFRTAMIARAIAKESTGNVVVSTALRWTKVLPRSTDQHSRRAERLLPFLRLISTVPAGKIVLVDDVMTTAGHMVASAWRLADQEREPTIGVCCGRTKHEQLPKPFVVPIEEIEIPERPG